MLVRICTVAYAALAISNSLIFQANAFSGPSPRVRMNVSKPHRLSLSHTKLQASVKDSRTSKEIEGFTELNRIKFMYNQLKGNIQEFELRALAAENRTRQSEKRLREYESQVDEESDRKSTEKLSEMKAHQKKERQKLDKKYNQLRNKLVEAEKTNEKSKADLLDAQTKIEQIEKKMNDAMDSLKLSSKAEYDSMKSQLESEVCDVKADYDEKLSIANDKINKLHKDLDQTTKDLTNKLISTEQHYKSMLVSLRAELSDSEEVAQGLDRKIQILERERSSIRTLARLQIGLLKQRIKKRYKSIRGKN